MLSKLAKIFFGPEVALAVGILRDLSALFESIRQGRQPNVAPLARRLFALVPEDFKAPKGPATEAEFVNAVFGVFVLFTRQR